MQNVKLSNLDEKGTASSSGSVVLIFVYLYKEQNLPPFLFPDGLLCKKSPHAEGIRAPPPSPPRHVPWGIASLLLSCHVGRSAVCLAKYEAYKLPMPLPGIYSWSRGSPKPFGVFPRASHSHPRFGCATSLVWPELLLSRILILLNPWPIHNLGCDSPGLVLYSKAHSQEIMFPLSVRWCFCKSTVFSHQIVYCLTTGYKITRNY